MAKKRSGLENGTGAGLVKRVIFTMGGKGGTGKTTFMAGLVEWFQDQGLRFDLVDLDSENKLQGSLRHFFPAARKVDVARERSLDVFLDILSSDVDVLLADMGAGQGQITYQWFDTIYEDAIEAGLQVDYTAVGVVTHDPASVESLLSWANRLQKRVDYLVVKNNLRSDLGFSALESEAAKRFFEVFQPAVIDLETRAGELEILLRQHGLTLGAVASRKESVTDPVLKSTSMYVRATGHRRRFYKQLDVIAESLNPAMSNNPM
jgi:hypothetical protein